MSPTRSLARPLMAAVFVSEGVRGLKSPGARVEAVRSAGLSDPQKLVQASAATQLAGGLALATGRLPRLSALALAGTLVPSTYLHRAFWTETDKQVKAQKQQQFLESLGLLGGLLLAFADTGGRESIPHAAARVSQRAQKKAAKAAKKAEKKLHS
jgi:uncharacterized membrane protein YphA (DoxX/SURF4 family)